MFREQSFFNKCLIKDDRWKNINLSCLHTRESVSGFNKYTILFKCSWYRAFGYTSGYYQD